MDCIINNTGGVDMLKPRLLTPRLLTQEEKEFNDKVWDLRIKYNSFDDFTEDIDDFITDQTPMQFSKITKHFKTPTDYMRALAEMSRYINSGIDVPKDLYEKIRLTRLDFKPFVK